MTIIGELNNTSTRICHELPGYNWVGDRIRKSVTNDQLTTQTSASKSITTTSSSNVNDSLEGTSSHSFQTPQGNEDNTLVTSKYIVPLQL